MSEFTDALDSLVKRVRQAAESATTEGARVIAEQATRNASGPPGPNEWTGNLKQAIRGDPAIPDGEDSFTSRIYVGEEAFYGTVQEHGAEIFAGARGPMLIRDPDPRGPPRPRADGPKSLYDVLIPPRPFFYRAFDESEADVQDVYENDYSNAFKS